MKWIVQRVYDGGRARGKVTIRQQPDPTRHRTTLVATFVAAAGGSQRHAVPAAEGLQVARKGSEAGHGHAQSSCGGQLSHSAWATSPGGRWPWVS